MASLHVVSSSLLEGDARSRDHVSARFARYRMYTRYDLGRIRGKDNASMEEARVLSGESSALRIDRSDRISHRCPWLRAVDLW